MNVDSKVVMRLDDIDDRDYKEKLVLGWYVAYMEVSKNIGESRGRDWLSKVSGIHDTVIVSLLLTHLKGSGKLKRDLDKNGYDSSIYLG